MLCNLKNISDIYDWAQEETVLDFLFREFHICKLPSRAQFCNLIGCVNSKKFQTVFIEWVEELVKNGEAISGILKRNLYNLNNLAKFIRCFIAVISVTELLQN